jgi:hypothetical protein
MDLQHISDRLEIDDLLTHFAVAIDTKQYDLLDDVFTADALIDYTAAGGIRGSYPEAKRWITEVMAPFTVCQHLIVNHDVRIDGDRAHVRSYLYNPLGIPDGAGGTKRFFVGGYYDDDCIRTADGWRIAGRVAATVWTDGAVPDELTG